MENQEKAKQLLISMAKNKPDKLYQIIDGPTVGIGMLLSYLNKETDPVSAGDIAKVMCVSTARIAVVLKKLEDQELIVRTADPADARKSMISLSPKGQERAKEVMESSVEVVAAIADRIGYEKLFLFRDLCKEIADTLEEILPGYINQKLKEKK